MRSLCQPIQGFSFKVRFVALALLALSSVTFRAEAQEAPAVDAPAVDAPAASTPAEPQPPKANTASAADQSANKSNCRKTKVTGSNLRTRQVCSSSSNASGAGDWVRQQQDRGAIGASAILNGGP